MERKWDKKFGTPLGIENRAKIYIKGDLRREETVSKCTDQLASQNLIVEKEVLYTLKSIQ